MHIKSKAGRTIAVPDDTEDRAVNAGIAADADTPELDDVWFARAQPAAQVLGAATLDVIKRRPGRPIGSVAAQTKEQVTLRLDPDVLSALRATGRGWQTRVNDLLRADIEAGRL